MKLQLIRNATMKISYGGKTILTDPMLSPKGAMDPFAGIARNPTAPLPFSTEEIIDGADAVLLSHNHPDHFDPAAGQALPKATPVFCQPEDCDHLSKEGFQNIVPIGETHTWEGITLTRTGGEHGKGEILKMMGTVSGFILQAAGEPTVYWAGDTIWCREVEEAINTFAPDIIITHSGGATLPGHDPIIMDDRQTLTVLEKAPQATVVAIHMESLDHCPVERQALRNLAENAAISPSRLIIPEDGETVML